MWAMNPVSPKALQPPAEPASPGTSAPHTIDIDDTTCLRCGEAHDLAKVKGCVKCLKCGFKFDCNGW
jgi:hypothetical protein